MALLPYVAEGREERPDGRRDRGDRGDQGPGAVVAMQVILRQDVEKVGLRGEVVDVAAGFARNYLLPRRLAEPAAPGRVAELEKLAAGRAQHEAQSFEQAQELVQKLEGSELRFDVQAGETGTLFGSVTATDIADRVWESRRVRIDRRKLDLPESIKRIGRYEVPVELFADVTATLRLAVVPEGRRAAARGRAGGARSGRSSGGSCGSSRGRGGPGGGRGRDRGRRRRGRGRGRGAACRRALGRGSAERAGGRAEAETDETQN